MNISDWVQVILLLLVILLVVDIRRAAQAQPVSLSVRRALRPFTGGKSTVDKQEDPLVPLSEVDPDEAARAITQMFEGDK